MRITVAEKLITVPTLKHGASIGDNAMSPLVIAPQTVFRFVGDDGENINIAVAPLQKWCKRSNSPIKEFDIDERLVHQFRFEDHAINEAHLAQLPDAVLDEPIILCICDWLPNGNSEVLLVDGRHRYVKRFDKGLAKVTAYMVPRQEWSQFQVTDIPDVTLQELRDSPVLKPTIEPDRDY
jgi:hypothetical protein